MNKALTLDDLQEPRSALGPLYQRVYVLVNGKYKAVTGIVSYQDSDGSPDPERGFFIRLELEGEEL